MRNRVGLKRSVTVDAQQYVRLYGDIVRQLPLDLVVDCARSMILVLDFGRRIVYASSAFLECVHASGIEEVLGRRPGDVFGCVNAREAGCGLGKNCCECGALLGIVSALDGRTAQRECLLTMEQDRRLSALEFQVRAVPFTLDAAGYVIVSFTDISHEKRRRALEQVFLHDILNSVGAARGLLHFLHEDLEGSPRDLLESVLPYFDLCVDEIAAQRKLLAAENNALVLSAQQFSLVELMERLVVVYRQHSLGSGKTICLDEDDPGDMVADRVVVHRICTNLLKNALEATAEGGIVTVRVRRVEGGQQLEIHNPGRIPDAVQRLLFRRSFSTRGEGRGLGTYSVQLLCNNYLGGKVWFTSTEEDGTTFFVRIPQTES